MEDRKKVPDLHLEQLLLDELEQSEYRKELENDGEIRQKLETLKESNAAILFSYPAHRMAGEIEGKLKKNKKSRAIIIIPRVMTALAAFVLILVAAFNIARPGNAPKDENRIKGASPHLEIYRQEFDGASTSSRILKEGETLHEYDRIQISYIAAGRKYGIIFSIDGSGYVSIYYPDSETQEPLLDTNGKVNLGYSLILDDAPLFEKYYFITSSREFSPEEIIIIAEDLARNPARVIKEKLDLPPGFEQHCVTFYKEVQ
ncbi:MAG: hypothetical protein JW874_10535 [Spirochaetales bacterium]|nr:hypothetical protein [Spirochaetales bacterium]